ncbi:hypothetical protein MLD38_011161 [Melastoma candidum]|uniref:Uncharacterized protein n=1 Tax=Melastoma candidum TaxID=119954 RepID=A0ACB9R3X9_9MYRT|nr:hypothetical protein MLD38_011161 [Melastoma candidum]
MVLGSIHGFHLLSVVSTGLNCHISGKEGNDPGEGNGESSVSQSVRTEKEILRSSNLKSFTFNDLKTATRNFRPDSVLGEGGFGCVFKGWIDEQTYTAAKPGMGLVIAVKRLNQDGLQGHKEWLVSTATFSVFDFGIIPEDLKR